MKNVRPLVLYNLHKICRKFLSPHTVDKYDQFVYNVYNKEKSLKFGSAAVKAQKKWRLL